MSNCFNESSEKASIQWLRATQSLGLIETVKRCYENSKFYREKFDEIGLKPSDIKSIDDITKLPFTVKSDFRANYPFGLFAVPREEIVRVHASSGTSGKQTVVGYTKNDINRWATCVARALTAAGVTNSDYVQISYGYGLFTGGLGIHYGVEKLGATAVPTSTGKTTKQIELMQDFKTNALCCTPSYALYMAEKMRDMGIDPVNDLDLRVGVFGGEAWSGNMRTQVEKELGIKAFDIYGMSELQGPGVSFECEAQDGLHINEDYFYPEIIDPQTLKPLPDGEYGELVFTCIGNEALPLLRYRTGDITALYRDECACGRTLVKMKKLRGRTDDMLVVRGINVYPSQIEHIILSLGLKPNYQIIVDRKDNLDVLTINIEMSESCFSDSVKGIEIREKIIRSTMKEALMIMPVIKLVEPKSLPRFQGKAERIIDRRKI